MAEGLTDAAIRNAKPRSRRYKIYDALGLFLIVTPTGGKWWRIKYRLGGKHKTLSLGTYPTVSLNEARVLRDNIRRIIQQGNDPSAIRSTEKAEKKQAQAETAVSVRYTMDGGIEIWKGTRLISLSEDEARFVSKQLSALSWEVTRCR